MFVCRRLCTHVHKSLFYETPSIFQSCRNVQPPSTKFAFLAKLCTMAVPGPVKFDYGTFIVELIPALQDNYMYVVIDKESNIAAAVDPVEPDKVLEVVKSHNTTLKYIWTTHHHWDHAGGNKKLVEKVPGISVYAGGDNVDAVTRILKDNEQFKLGEKTLITVIATPCHTKTSICYHVYDKDQAADVVFTGDTLFVAGAGKFFEGDGAQMNNNLNNKLAALHNFCKVFCGHEYTVNNLEFSSMFEDNNARIHEKLKWAIEQRRKKEPTVPSSICDEKLTNPFMRLQHLEYEALVEKCGGDLNKTMDLLREKKNNFQSYKSGPNLINNK